MQIHRSAAIAILRYSKYLDVNLYAWLYVRISYSLSYAGVFVKKPHTHTHVTYATKSTCFESITLNQPALNQNRLLIRYVLIEFKSIGGIGRQC